MPNAPVESKVKAATAAGAGSAAVVTPFVVWVVDQLFFNGDATPEVPLPVVGMIGLVVTGACTFVGGWYAKHTPRPTD
ncbi:hypothetical protein GCM10027290_17170 [Micromonospora sonneratiae]|uniref:Holin n=1 Tax=Micromonospora sonneratiae TaxID=1184706 RepID=A0ABW3YFN6_9ACTN